MRIRGKTTLASALDAPELKSASGTSERIGLVQDWLDYLFRGAEGGAAFVVFQSDNDYYMQFAVEAAGRRVHAEIGTFEWEKRLGAPIPDSAAGRLIGHGFKRPQRGFVNYWQDFDQTRARSLAQITEWAFREVFGERLGFTLQVSSFKSDARNPRQKVSDSGESMWRKLADKTAKGWRSKERDKLCAHLRDLGIEAQMAELGRMEEGIGEGIGGGHSRGLIDIIDGPIRWVNLRTETTANYASSYIEYGVPVAKGLQARIEVRSIRVKTFPLVGKVVDVRWRGDDLGLGIINRLNGNISTKDLRVLNRDVKIRTFPEHGCWIISTETYVGPSEELWSCYQAIAQQLLDTAHRS